MTAWVAGGQKVNFHAEFEYLPFVFDDGCVQFIDGVFEDLWPKNAAAIKRNRNW
jgi:hypothetical protein